MKEQITRYRLENENGIPFATYHDLDNIPVPSLKGYNRYMMTQITTNNYLIYCERKAQSLCAVVSVCQLCVFFSL